MDIIHQEKINPVAVFSRYRQGNPNNLKTASCAGVLRNKYFYHHFGALPSILFLTGRKEKKRNTQRKNIYNLVNGIQDDISAHHYKFRYRVQRPYVTLSRNSSLFWNL